VIRILDPIGEDDTRTKVNDAANLATTSSLFAARDGATADVVVLSAVSEHRAVPGQTPRVEFEMRSALR
jgi:hypothetical protein